MAKQKRLSSVPSGAIDTLNAVYVTNYEITDEPIQERSYRRLPNHVKDVIERLHYDSQTKPRKAIPEIRAMLKKYPQIPQLYNYLTVAYAKIGEVDKAEAVTRANIRKNPDYLFARLNYAEFCLRRKEYEKIPEIFEQKYDLQLLYPKRKRFHISEVVNFMGLMGVYFYEIGEKGVAEKYNAVLQKIAPNDPMAKRLQGRLSPNVLVRLFQRFTGK